MEWTLTKIRAKIRKLTGRLSTSQLSDSELDDYINSFYQYLLPEELHLFELDTWYEISTVNGTGEYALDVNMRSVVSPVTIDGKPIALSFDPTYFFNLYPRNEEATATKQEPTHCLVYDRIIYLRPIPDAVYVLRAAVPKRPNAMTQASDKPEDSAWGLFIAYGVAIDIHMDNGEKAEADEKVPYFEYLRGSIENKQLKQTELKRSIPRF
ncbi:MAG: hypothetical protein ACFFCW_33130 [Candidatus Hodarchaeota archaeon]